MVMRFEVKFTGNIGNVGSGYVLIRDEIHLVKSLKDLGVLIDFNLKFHSHTFSAVGKSSDLANELLRSKVNSSCDFMVSLFISHNVRFSIIDLRFEIWGV